MNAAWESLVLAARELAAASPIKHRLTNAFSKHLSELDAAELPHEVRQRFRDLQARLTVVPPMRGESAICATVRKMSNDEAAECACCIVDILGACSPAPVVRPGRVEKRSPAAIPLPRLIAEA